MRIIDALWVEITSDCNRRCPDCASNIGNRPAVHHQWEYFEELAPYLDGIKHVNLTGGEPLLHPQFDEFAPQWKDLFRCERLTVWTNGYQARRHAQALAHFDQIWASRYGDNDEDIEWLAQQFDAGVWQGQHIPRNHRGGGKPCGRGTSDAQAIYAVGRFFPCCVGPGIPGAKSLAPTEDWRDKVLGVSLPCAECWFSV